MIFSSSFMQSNHHLPSISEILCASMPFSSALGRHPVAQPRVLYRDALPFLSVRSSKNGTAKVSLTKGYRPGRTPIWTRSFDISVNCLRYCTGHYRHPHEGTWQPFRICNERGRRVAHESDAMRDAVLGFSYSLRL